MYSWNYFIRSSSFKISSIYIPPSLPCTKVQQIRHPKNKQVSKLDNLKSIKKSSTNLINKLLSNSYNYRLPEDLLLQLLAYMYLPTLYSAAPKPRAIRAERKMVRIVHKTTTEILHDITSFWKRQQISTNLLCSTKN